MPKGNIKLDSKLALSFVRERHHLENGDYDRGKNQEKVIEAVIKKIANIRKYNKDKYNFRRNSKFNSNKCKNGWNYEFSK